MLSMINPFSYLNMSMKMIEDMRLRELSGFMIFKNIYQSQMFEFYLISGDLSVKTLKCCQISP